MKLSKQYDIQVPKFDDTIKTDPDFIKLHGVILANAKRNTGKSCALTNLLRLMKENNALDRLILVSPTYHNNSHYFKNLPLDPNDVLEPTIDVPAKLEHMLNLEAEEYEQYLLKMKRYRKLIKLIKNPRVNVQNIDNDLILEFVSDTGLIEPPIPKYDTNKKPSIAVFFDDTQGTELMKPSSKLSNIVVKHRHLGKMKEGALGATLLFATQNYTSNSMGINKAIRGNTTHLLVFRNKNIKELEKIAEECSGEIDTDTFFKLHHKATKDSQHDFLFIDLHPKKDHMKFRKNFNEFLTV